jgi:hypothetical protein
MTVPDANAGRGPGAAPGAGKPAEGDSASPGAAEAKPGAETDPGAGEAKPGAQAQPGAADAPAAGGQAKAAAGGAKADAAQAKMAADETKLAAAETKLAAAETKGAGGSELTDDEHAELQRLREEVAQLRSQPGGPAGPAAPGRRRRLGWRGPVATVLIVVACLLAPLSVFAVWTANQVSNTDRYVANVDRHPDPSVQRALTDDITARSPPGSM